VLDPTTCRYFTGTANKVCEKGIPYESVAQLSGNEHVAPMYKFAYPCLPHGLPLSGEVQASLCCAQASYPTKEEEEEDRARVMDIIKADFEKIANNICPNHNIVITKVQIKRCVYAEPCGCRLYQGKLKKGK